MKLRGLLLAFFALAVVPAALAQAPTLAQRSAAARICAGLEQAMGTATFKATYGTNATRSNASGMCVSRWAKIEQQDTLKATHQCGIAVMRGRHPDATTKRIARASQLASHSCSDGTRQKRLICVGPVQYGAGGRPSAGRNSVLGAFAASVPAVPRARTVRAKP